MVEWWAIITQYLADLAAAAWLKALLAFSFTAAARFVGWDYPPIEALITLMICDYILGFAHAWKEDRIDIGRMKRGLGKFVGYSMALYIAGKADQGMGIHLEALYSLRNLLCAYLVANEAISALTHLGAFGVPIPVWIMDRLRRYRKSIEKPRRRRDDVECPPPGDDHEQPGI